ncbi:SWIM-type domain-containing protein [Trichonephila inaurata madagascariensis]|uniref:SWIM-type domain-containing protein n=1 Tax=Trichonephila inaurata madagascariensis TaxID=2747483 RepID=A0A8X6XIY0_9ARAC|nr:SWIM-type domain-containing protein [Trichonephila inaurata madagascariensis]
MCFSIPGRSALHLRYIRDPENVRLRIVEAAAAIIREDIRSFVVETRSYPPPSKMLIKENQERRYRSERLIDVLYSLGFAALYGKTVQYEISIAYHPQPRILSSESGALVRYVGDNADINVHTLDGNEYLLIPRQKQARGDVDVLIVETAIEKSEQKAAVIVGEDIDLLVILIGRTQSNQEMFSKKVGKMEC